MSLLDEAYEEYTYMNKTKTDDGYGGVETVWSPGPTIKGAMVYNGTDEGRIAQALGSTESYQFVCKKDTELDYHDVLQRNSDSKLFRILKNSDDFKTPKSAGLNMRVYEAEELTALPR